MIGEEEEDAVEFTPKELPSNWPQLLDVDVDALLSVR
jgi:hypothetical protein